MDHSKIREAAEDDLYTFIKLIAPNRVLGHVHEEIIRWWCREEAHNHQLLLIPRGHQKSVLAAFRAAWHITKNPVITILYISSTANLAEKQLSFIKKILTSKVYTRYWPDMINPEEGKREKWSVNEIAVDHPDRVTEGVRDPTVFTAGLTTGITGMHCDLCVLDDVVVQENAYTEEGRRKVEMQYSLLASIENPEAIEITVGTRYHPRDLYGALADMEKQDIDEDGNVCDSTKVYEVFERKVENKGDGTGEFLWPRQRRDDGQYFGFNSSILSIKKAQYLDKSQFFAQYYNDPNDRETSAISSDYFQYYDRKYLRQEYGNWYFKDKKLNVYSSMDFAFSLNKRADYTALVIIGVDSNYNFYVLDIDRFKTSRIEDYYTSILKSYLKWDFRKLRAECTAGQKVIVRSLKDRLRQEGYTIKIDEFTPTRNLGTKEERIAGLLEPRYTNLQIYHYRGGNCQTLEDELLVRFPPHDDVKDALASAVDIAIAPKERRTTGNMGHEGIVFNSRFGGVSL